MMSLLLCSMLLQQEPTYADRRGLIPQLHGS